MDIRMLLSHWLIHSFDWPKCHLETSVSNTSAKAQSFILCLIGVVLCPNLRSSSSSRAAATRLVQHKDTLIKIIKLADSNSVICRSKSFLVLYLILNMQPDLLLAACKHKVRSDFYLEPNHLRNMNVSRLWRRLRGNQKENFLHMELNVISWLLIQYRC